MGRLIFIFLLLVGTISSPAEADLRWKYETDGRVYSTPLIAGGMVYFGSGDHHFYALNKETGEQIWSFETGGAVHSSAATKGNLLYFGSGERSVPCPVAIG